MLRGFGWDPPGSRQERRAAASAAAVASRYTYTYLGYMEQWRGERYDGTSTRTGPLESEKSYKQN